MKSLPTIKIEHEGGYAVINLSDFDKDKHKEFKEKPVKKAPAKKAAK